ncbi:MAG: hypothetical protein J5829_09730 [Lachnospiraceae bacterium]|nr:hypothetical protein [Lachnospiraceae bacterium]
MIAAEDKVLNKAVSGVWQLTEEERIREQCRAREEWLLMDQWKNNKIEEQGQTIEEQGQRIKDLEAELARYKSREKPGTP